MLGQTGPLDQPNAAHRRTFRSEEELKMRDLIEAWGRNRWPGRRVVHELVMGRGENRADVVFIGTEGFSVVEIKSSFDTSSRMLAQVAMFCAASQEVWLYCDGKFTNDVKLVRHLLPRVGHLHSQRDSWNAPLGDPEIIHEAKPRVPFSEALLSLLWVAELTAEARRASVWQGNPSRPPTHAALVRAMLKLTAGEQMAAVCRQLRARDALWRADPPVAA